MEFAHRSDMEYALKKLDDSELNGQRVRLFEVLCGGHDKKRNHADYLK